MNSEASNQANFADSKSDWLSQLYEVHDKEAAQVSGGKYPESGTTDVSGITETADQDITSAFLNLFDTQTEILKAKLDGKVLGAILSAYNDALQFIK